jgi:AcrR family transcriptional regulator
MIWSVAATAEAEESKRPGRPRDARVEAVVRQAVRDALAEGGFGALTIDGVAARAGVGKATIYRRWRSKEELVRDALGELLQQEAAPDTGSLAGDLRVLIDGFVTDIHGVRGQLMPSLCGEAQTDPDLAAILDSFSSRKHELMAEVFRRAKKRGEVRATVDPEIALDMLLGPIVFRKLITRGTIDERLGEQIVALLVAACAPR